MENVRNYLEAFNSLREAYEDARTTLSERIARGTNVSVAVSCYKNRLKMLHEKLLRYTEMVSSMYEFGMLFDNEEIEMHRQATVMLESLNSEIESLK